MSNKEVVHTLSDNKQELQKQLGCMNGILQIFDHLFLLGQRRHGHNQKRLTPGQSTNGETDLRNDKEKFPKVVTKDQSRVSIELPRHSFSSPGSSTAMSLLDGNRNVQRELSSPCQSVIFEPSSSPLLRRKQADLFMQSPDIRDVVKDSMTREPRVVSIKKVAKDERVVYTMKHVDSPRPYHHQKPIQYEKIERHLRELKEATRFSCDGRESRYQLKSNMKIKELPRLSLDSRQGYISNAAANDPTSNKRVSSGVVARLMGLEGLTVDESKTLKTNSCLREESVLTSKSSPRVNKPKRAVKVSHVVTRIPLEKAPWKPSFKNKECPPRAEPGSRSIYDEIEKRLTEHEFKTAGKDLRALKQILEAMQKTKKRLEIKEPALDDSSIAITQQKAKDAEARQDLVGRNRLKDPNVRDRKATRKQLSTSNFPECSGTVSPNLQRSKYSMNGPSSGLSRPKKQRASIRSANKYPKAKSMDPLQDSSETRNLSQQSDAVSERSQEVNSPFQPKENHKVNITEWLTEEKSTVDHAKHTMEQPSPVSVLDAFYTEDTPSPVKKKVTDFSEDKNLQYEEAKDHQHELLNSDTDDVTVNHTVAYPCEGETGDHRYVEEIMLASGCLGDLDRATTIVQLHPTAGFINPDLYHVLEKTKTCKKFMTSKIRRKLVFDTLNDVLGHKLAMLGSHKGRILNADKLLKELWSGLDGLQNKSAIGVSDGDDEVINIINADVNKRSQDWDEYCLQVPGLVLDIERLIFKDLICEVVNG